MLLSGSTCDASRATHPKANQNFCTIISVSRIVPHDAVTTAMLRRLRAAMEIAEVGYTASEAFAFLRGAGRFLTAMMSPKRGARPMCDLAPTPSLPEFISDHDATIA